MDTCLMKNNFYFTVPNADIDSTLAETVQAKLLAELRRISSGLQDDILIAKSLKVGLEVELSVSISLTASKKS